MTINVYEYYIKRIVSGNQFYFRCLNEKRLYDITTRLCQNYEKKKNTLRLKYTVTHTGAKLYLIYTQYLRQTGLDLQYIIRPKN